MVREDGCKYRFWNVSVFWTGVQFPSPPPFWALVKGFRNPHKGSVGAKCTIALIQIGLAQDHKKVTLQFSGPIV